VRGEGVISAPKPANIIVQGDQRNRHGLLKAVDPCIDAA
jgi:hypothetical protein